MLFRDLLRHKNFALSEKPTLIPRTMSDDPESPRANPPSREGRPATLPRCHGGLIWIDGFVRKPNLAGFRLPSLKQPNRG
jgi:hypothetical protein